MNRSISPNPHANLINSTHARLRKKLAARNELPFYNTATDQANRTYKLSSNHEDTADDVLKRFIATLGVTEGGNCEGNKVNLYNNSDCYLGGWTQYDKIAISIDDCQGNPVAPMNMLNLTDAMCAYPGGNGFINFLMIAGGSIGGMFLLCCLIAKGADVWDKKQRAAARNNNYGLLIEAPSGFEIEAEPTRPSMR